MAWLHAAVDQGKRIERLREAVRTPEYRALQSERSRGRKRSPEAIAKGVATRMRNHPARQVACHPKRKHYGHGLCRACYLRAGYSIERRAAYMAKWNARNPGRLRDRDLRRRFGISLEDYNVMLANQGGRCAVCRRTPEEVGRSRALDVDHDHATGRIRGLLCAPCNTAIGFLDEQPDRVAALLQYLSRVHAEAST